MSEVNKPMGGDSVLGVCDMIEMNELGPLPTRNWQTGVFGRVKGIALSEI